MINFLNGESYPLYRFMLGSRYFNDDVIHYSLLTKEEIFGESMQDSEIQRKFSLDFLSRSDRCFNLRKGINIDSVIEMIKSGEANFNDEQQYCRVGQRRNDTSKYFPILQQFESVTYSPEIFNTSEVIFKLPDMRFKSTGSTSIIQWSETVQLINIHSGYEVCVGDEVVASFTRTDSKPVIIEHLSFPKKEKSYESVHWKLNEIIIVDETLQTFLKKIFCYLLGIILELIRLERANFRESTFIEMLQKRVENFGKIYSKLNEKCAGKFGKVLLGLFCWPLSSENPSIIEFLHARYKRTRNDPVLNWILEFLQQTQWLRKKEQYLYDSCFPRVIGVGRIKSGWI